MLGDVKREVPKSRDKGWALAHTAPLCSSAVLEISRTTLRVLPQKIQARWRTSRGSQKK